MSSFDAIEESAAAIRKLFGDSTPKFGPQFKPRVAVVLGSGLGSFVDRLSEARSLAYSEVPHFPKATVEGHAGRLVVGRCAGIDVVCMQGRFHFYEGYEPSLLVAPIRALRLAGIETFVMTNAAGGIDPSYRPGDLMVISDHLNFSGRNPLVGPHDQRYGPRFPDMSIAYDSALRRMAHEVARKLKQELREGVYAVLGGPSYETPAEVRALRILGGAAVGMSTVYEVIAARQMGARVLGLSLITNHAAGVAQELLDHAEVVAVGREASGRIVALLEGVLGRLGQEQSGQERFGQEQSGQEQSGNEQFGHEQ